MSTAASMLGLRMATPATATWVAPMAAYYLFLQQRVVMQRYKSKTIMGDTSDSKLGAKDPLFIASRSQANFIENVPLAIIVSLLAELNGANRKYINYGLGALLVFRIAHVEMGMLRPETKGPGRAVGFFGTQAFIAGFAGYIVYLVKDYWMS